MLPIAKLSAAHRAIATIRGVVNMLAIPKADAGLHQQAPSRTRKIGLQGGCLTWAAAGERSRSSKRGRHVPIRNRGAESWSRSGDVPRSFGRLLRAAGAAGRYR